MSIGDWFKRRKRSSPEGGTIDAQGDENVLQEEYGEGTAQSGPPAPLAGPGSRGLGPFTDGESGEDIPAEDVDVS